MASQFGNDKPDVFWRIFEPPLDHVHSYSQNVNYVCLVHIGFENMCTYFPPQSHIARNKKGFIIKDHDRGRGSGV